MKNSQSGNTKNFKRPTFASGLGWLLGIWIFLGAGEVWGQVSTLQNWTLQYHNTSTATQNVNYAVATGTDNNRILVVAIASSQTTAGARTVTISYGGQAMTLAEGDMELTTSRQHTAIYYLDEAGLDAATNTSLSFQVSGGTTRVTTVWAAVFDHVVQSNPITDSRTNNSLTTAVDPIAFGSNLTINSSDQAILLVSTVRSGNTTPRNIDGYPSNFSGVGNETWTTTDGVRNAIANRNVPATNTTTNGSTNLSNSALASITGVTLKGCPQPTANAGSALAAICQGGTSAALGGSVGGSATGGTWSSSAGGSFSPNATTLNATWSPPPGYTGTATLTLTTSGGSCGIATASKTIVVNPPATVGAVSPNQTICSGSSPSDLTIASATGTIQWQRADNLAFTSNVTNVGTNSTTLTSAQIGPLTATRYFRAVVTSGGCTSATSSIITVTVSPASAVGAISGDQTITTCSGSAAMSIASATGTIQWQQADDAAFLFNVVNIPGATGLSYTATGLTETRYFRAVVTSGSCPPATSGVITITVNPSVTGITPNQTVCSGTAPANISVFTATGNIQWQVATNAAFTTGVSDISGATGLTLTSAQMGTITAPRYYRARVRNPGNTCTIYSDVVTVLIDPVNTATSASPNQTVCRNASLVPITFTTTGADNIGTPVNLPPGLTAVWVSNTITISGTPTTAGTYNYSIPLTGGCGTVAATGTITVSQSSIINDMTRSVCSGTAFSAIPVNGTDGVVLAGTTYSWSAPTVTGGMTGGAAGTGTLATGITGTLINPTNIPRTATYRVTPRVGTCDGDPFDVVVTVNPTPVIPAQNETICSGSAFNISPVNGAPSAATIVPAGTTYTWTVSSNPNVTGQSNQATAQTKISQTLVNTSNVNQTLTYTVTPTSGAAGSCPGTPFTITVTVNPVPVIPAQTATICSGTAFSVTPTNGTPTVATIVPAGTTYTWTVVDNPNVTGEANQAAPQPLISQTLTNTTNTLQNVVYTVTPTSGVTGNCIGSTFTVTVAVEPRPAISAMTEAVCSGDTFTVIPANGINGIVPAGTTYTWSIPVVTGSMTGGVAGSGGNITGTLTNPTNSPQTATYTVTPTSGTCVGSPFTVTVTVNPRPAVTAVTSIICSGDTFTAAPANGTDGIVPIGTTYTWTAPTLSGGITGGIAGSGPNITGTLTNTSNSVQTATYTVTPTSGTCAGSPFTLTVTVNPRPAITAMTAEVCSGDSFTVTPANSTNGIVPAGTTFTWTAPTLSGGITGGIAGSGPNITGTLTNTTNSPQTATYTVTPASGSCAGSTFTVTITVNPRPAVTAMVESICSGDSFTVTPANGTNGIVPAGISYAWSAPVVTGGITGGVAGSGSSITGTLTNPTNTAQTATYTVIPTSGTCAGNAFTVTVTVNPRPAVTAITETICSGDTFTVTPANGTNGIVPSGISYTWTIPVVTGGITGGAGGSGSSITGTLTNPTNSVQTATYTVTPTSGSCAGSSFTVTITVSPRPAVTNMTETVCNGDSFTVTPSNGTNGIVPAGTTYTWSAPVVTGGVTGGVAGSGTNITGTLTNPTNSAQTATYTVTPTSGSCVGPTFTVTVTLSPSPSVTNMNSTVCSDEPFNLTPANGTNGIVPTGTTYTWSAPVVSGGMTGGVAGSGTSIGGTLSNPTNTVQTATYTVTPATGSCVGGTFTVTITVSPKPVISNITQAVCNGDAFTVTPTNGTNGIVPTGTTYTWTVQSVTGGITGAVSGSGSNITGTLTNPTTSPQTATYTVTPTSGSCVGSSFTVTVTVNPLTNLTSQPSTTDFEVCFGDGFAPISVTATGTALTYQWFRNTTNSNSGGSPVSGATSATFAVPSTPEGVAYYYVVVTGTCGVVTSAVSGSYTVFPPVTTFTSNLSNTPQTICPGGSFTPISAVATGANLTYQWYSNSTPSNSGGTLIPGEESESFTPPNTVFGPVYYYVVAKSDCGTVPSAVSGAFAVTGATSVSPNQTVCVNTPLDPVITHSTSGTTGIGTVTGLPPGVTATWSANVITISGTPTTTVGSPFNYSIQLIGACSTQVATGTITVNPRAEITAINTSVCSGSGFNLTPANGTNGVVPGGTTYSWSAPVVTGGITGGAAGSGGASISGTLTNPTNTVQTATYTVTPLTGSCPGPTFTVTVSVNPSPIIPAQTATTCSGSAFTVSPVNGAGTIVPTGTTYTWTVVDNPNVTGDVVQGTPQGNISQTLTNTTNVAQTVVYTVTPTSGAAGNCVGAPFTVTVTVEPAPVIPAQSASTCSGSAFTVAPSNGGTTIVPAGTTYTWTVADNPNVTGESNQGTAQGSISQTLTNTSNTVQTVIYTVTPITGTCSGTPFTLTVSVNPSPVIPAQTATTCSGSAFTVSPTNSGITIVPLNTSYTWTVVDNPSVTGDVAQGTPQGNISQTLINNTNVAQTVVYTVTPTSGAAGNCVGAPFTVTVTVNPRPAVSNITPASVCSGTAFTVSPSNGTNGIVPSGTTYSWPVPIVTGSMTGGASGSNSNNITGTLTNPTNSPQTATYTVTPTSGGCAGTPFTVVVTINPTPAIPNQTPPAICSGSAFTVSPVNNVPSAATRVPAGTLYTWTVTPNGNVTGEANETTPQTSISQTLTNTTNAVQTVVYTVTPISGGCAGTPFTTTVTVNPSPAIPDQTPAAICSGSAFTVTPSNGGSTIVPSNTRYTWTVVDNPNVTGESNQGTSQTSISQALTNISNVAQTVVYTVTPISGAAGSCVGPTFTISVTVNPRPLITPSPITQTICGGQTFNVSPVNGTNGIVPAGTTYTWTRVNNFNVSGDTNEPNPQTSIFQTLTNNTTSVQSVTYTVTPSVAGCPAGPNFQVVVTVNPVPTVTNGTLTQTICSGGSSTLVNLTSGLTGTAFNWTATATPGVSGFLTNGTGPIPAQTISTTATTQGTVTYVITPSLNGCSGPTVNYTIRVNPRPVITINADYCVVAGKVRLTASSTVPISGWSWNTNPIQTTQSIDVDLAGNYTVTATPSSGSGCLGTASISIAQELVVNGSFTAGNTGFVSDYLFLPDIAGNNELVDDTGNRGYSIVTNGQNVHPDFWGQDHTNNTPGPRNMMIVNGKGGTLRIWEQTITVEPNTEYYFSAWAMSVNNAGPFARLRFEVNGSQVGTIADLPAGFSNNSNNGWQRFNGTWNSGSVSGPITVRIVNLQPSLPGNDFAIDDISFGTLSTFIELTSPVNTDNQAVCQNSPIEDITYAARSSTAGPTVSGLPPGITTSWNGVTLRFTGTPTASGTFNYTITTTGNCLPATATGTITVLNTPTAGIISADQTICSGGDPVAFISNTAGTGSGVITYLWESNTNLTSPSWTTISGQTGATYDVPAGLTTTTQYRRTTIATSGTVVCQSVPTEPIQVTVQAIPTAGTIGGAQTICLGGDPAAITSTAAGTGSGAITYIWESAIGPFTSWTTISGANGASYNPPAGLTETTRYRRTTVSTINGVACLSTTSSPVEVTVQSTPTAGVIAAPQTFCGVGDPAAFTSTTNGTGDGTITYRWESAVSPFSTWSTITGANSATYDAPAGLTVSTQYRRVTISTLNSVSCESAPTAPIEVTIQNTPTAGAIAAAQSICSGGDPEAFNSSSPGTGSGSITYRWESAVSPFSSWTTISGATSETYDVPAGLTVTTQYRRVAISTLNGAACEAVTTPVQVTILPENTVTPVNPDPAFCLATASSIIITHTTTGATGIVPQSATVDWNLPNGVTPSWNAGVLTIQGTPTEFGVFNYSIPLTGGCGSINATGTITVENPNYPITSINVVNPTSLPGSSTFTVFSPNMTPGTYEIRYSTNGVNGGANNELTTVVVSTAGQFTLTSPVYNNEGSTVLTINSIQKIIPNPADPCPYFPPNNNTAVYGFGCSSESLQSGGSDIFYVPAGIFELRIQAFGDGSSPASSTVPVIPGGTIFIGVVGNTIFATKVPLASATASDYLVSAIGPNGRIVINYECTPPPPCSGTGDVFQYTDSEGFTVIRITGDCSSWTWDAPDGLDEFEVLVVGGGGGGGFGEAAGGGGGGGVVYRQYLGITMNGLPGLQNASFTMTPGAGGQGAANSTTKGGLGEDSSFSGPTFNYSGGNTFTNLLAQGGGGGGSSNATATTREGGAGASGGGGAAYGTDESNGGSGMDGSNGGNGMGEATTAGGGGGGGMSSLGGNGASSGGGTIMTAGSGGNGVMRSISGENIFYGAGGGGTSSGSITNIAGTGGSPYTGPNNIQYHAGGNGNNNGVGQTATTYGSGGGAGRTGGASGFRGVVYIRYPNFRILNTEYLYFNALYNSSLRSGDLSWATAKEWDNDRFEIERSVNTATNWEKIGELAAAGYSDGHVKYDFRDLKLPLAGGTIFYRLKQVDFNGEYSYSVTRAIRVEPMEGVTHWRVYPNPTTGDPFDIELINPEMYQDETVTLRVISATGHYQTFVFDQIGSMGMRVSDWFRTQAAGIYTLEISWGAQREYHKVILRR